MNKLKVVLATMGIVAGMSLCAASAVNTIALASPAGEAQKGIDAIGGNDPGNKSVDFGDKVKSVVNILLYIVGICAVVVIVIAGLMYVVSSGDSGKTKSAKDTILYAVVGLVIAILAYAIVNFVISAFTPRP